MAAAPRLLERYRTETSAKLSEEFGYKNPHEVPRLDKIVVNMGLGEALANPKVMERATEELAGITGQKPVIRKARKSIANFKLRQGQTIGASVTLRGWRMWEFFDRLVSTALPRVRDFQGVSPKAFDGRGNYTLGIKEQIIFPEVDIEEVREVHGMDITVVTTTDKDDEAFALLREMGFPFRGEVPVQIGGGEAAEAA